MTSIKPFWRLAKLPLAVSLASTLASPAFGINFNIGEIEGQFDSSLSVGASWSTAKGDKNLIGANNGGRGLSQTSDDPHLNFKRGETFSKIFKGIHDLELKYGDTGVFVRGKYWYDFELKDESRPFKDIDDHNRKEGAQASGAQILDAFVYHNYSIADKAGSVRLGKQVLSWGESTFIQNGINSTNPVDVSAFRRPGAEIKEGLVPVNMFYVSQSLTDNLSAEVFYQLEWDQTVVENCGTFFSTADIVADGCDSNLAVLSSKQSTYSQLLASFGGNAALANTALGLLEGLGTSWTSNPDEGVLVRRGGDRDASDEGQWGLAMRYMFEPLDTEFGAYFMNYHSRAPVFSGTAPSAAAMAGVNGAASLAASLAGVPAAARLAALGAAANGKYFMEYPEDIRLYGLSFSTTLPTGTAWSGEVSYRPNAPVQLNSTDVLYAALKGINIGGVVPYANVSPLGPGSDGDLHGYRRKEITQLQTTFTHFIDQVMGASRLTLVGEVGWTHVGGLESTKDIRYGRDPIFGSAGGMCQTVNTSTAGANPDFGNIAKGCDRDGFTTADSWGYRARAIWEYPDALAGVNLRPSLAWSHDVSGYSPGPGGNFEEGRKAISVGMDAEYQNTYTASLSYTDFFDGKYSTVDDRDFLALSFGVNF